MRAEHFLSTVLRKIHPGLWQRLKYRDYLRHGEPEIHLLHHFVPSHKIAVDVGVHLGMYARHLAGLSSGVVAFEANPDSAAFLTGCLAGLADVRACALSSETGIATLRVPVSGANGGEAALGTLASGNSLGGLPLREVQVPMAPLDSFALPDVGFVKVDVEGHEESVLAGATGVIERDRPNFMIEVEERHNPGSVERIPAWFAARGYRTLYHKDGRFHDIATFRANDQTVGAASYINNFFYVPADRLASLALPMARG